MGRTGHKKIRELLLFCCLTSTFHTLCLGTNDNSCFCKNVKGGCIFTQQYDNSHRKENVALGKRASLSSVWENTLPACLAVNGNINRQYFRISESNPNCANSMDSENSTWELDLGREYDINSITVYTMDKYETQMYGVLITIDDKFCYNITTTERREVINMTCYAPLSGQRVKLFKYASYGEKKYLSFCEVQVWACVPGAFGKDCASTCGHCIDNLSCDRVNGTCLTCKPGFIPPFCQSPCTFGYYGYKCASQCGNCKDNATCHNTNGHCSSCQLGFMPPMCQLPCTAHTFGPDCAFRCGHCSDDAPCNTVNGSCVSCKSGFVPPLCQSACKNRTYGQDCVFQCGNCKGNAPCDNVNGTCSSCEPGFISPFCRSPCENGTYGYDCAFLCGNCTNNTSCDKVDGSCISCEDGFTLPLCLSVVESFDHQIHIVSFIVGVVVGLTALGIVTFLMTRNKCRIIGSR